MLKSVDCMPKQHAQYLYMLISSLLLVCAFGQLRKLKLATFLHWS